MSTPTATPVLIVGAGPAGLITAITLARYGVRTLIVERRTKPAPYPRASGITIRTMELMRAFGVEERIREGDMNVEAVGWMTDTLASPDGVEMPMGFPSLERAREVSPTTWVSAPQDHLEPVLIDHLSGYPHAEIRFGAELLALEQDGDGVRALIGSEGSVTSIRCQYVVGADGGHSVVRRAVGIAMDGSDDLAAYYTVLFRAPLDRVLGGRRLALYMVGHPRAAGVFVRADKDDRWVYSQRWDPTTESLDDYPHDRLIDLIRQGAGSHDLHPEILNVGAFTFAAQVAERYREGHVFLVGDAAHRMTPRGATGMNTAIHDAYNLGWKLGWVLRGWASLELLDTYEEERRPVGIRNTARSAHEGPRDVSGDHLDDLDGRIPHAWLERDGARISTLDLLGPGLTLITGADNRAWTDAVSDLSSSAPVDVHGVDDATGHVLGIRPGGAILVRPDGRPVWLWESGVSDTPAELRSAIRELLDVRAPACAT